MRLPPHYKFNIMLLARDVRAKRGEQSLRDISAQTGLAIAVLSRVENAKLPPDYDNLGILCGWLGINPAKYFILNNEDDDPIVGQLRAAQNMSAETASAFMDIIRAAYEQMLEATDDEDKA